MVAQERMKVAGLEAELTEVASQREAMKLAMRVLEDENQRFRDTLSSASQAAPQVKTTTPAQRLSASPSRSHSRRSSLSVPNALASLQYPTPVEPLPSVGDGTYRAESPTTDDLTEHQEFVQPHPVTLSPPPPLDVDCWSDSPVASYYTSAPPETAEPD